jgi:outer membrane protein assembly factor BamA
LEENNLFRFIKTDVEYKHLISKTHSQLAFRVFGGVGLVYGTKNGQSETNLPFFKAYFAGGPYSMRAWQVRRLGPGSSLLYDTTGNQLNDRFGNMQLEANVEYRFDLTTIAGIKVKSALFADMGNIWGNEFKDANATQKIEEASFKPSRLYRDLAVAGGTSLRFDFDFFLIRLDWAYKLKDPRYADLNGGWFHNIKLLQGQFQLGINYPF